MAVLVAVTLCPAPAFAAEVTLIRESSRFADDRTGDGNGTVQPGETVEVLLALRNDGDVPVSGIRVTIDAAHADEVEGARDFPDAAPGETVRAEPFVLRIHDDAPVGGVFPCEPRRLHRESPEAEPEPAASTVPVAFVHMSFDVRAEQGSLTIQDGNTIICGNRIVRETTTQPAARKSLPTTGRNQLPWLVAAGALLAAGMPLALARRKGTRVR